MWCLHTGRNRSRRQQRRELERQRNLNVLINCEMSGAVRRAFRALGHDAYSCDLSPSMDGSPHHIQGDAFDAAQSRDWDLMIAHPPCTYLCRSGWHWVNKPDSDVHPLKGAPRRKAAEEAARFFRRLLDLPIPKIAVENPRPIKHVNLPAPTQAIQPWQFGHGEVKETCLWLRGLPLLTPTNIVDGRVPVVHYASPGEKDGLTRQQRRSITYEGIATAMAQQWGS